MPTALTLADRPTVEPGDKLRIPGSDATMTVETVPVGINTNDKHTVRADGEAVNQALATFEQREGRPCCPRDLEYIHRADGGPLTVDEAKGA